MPTLLNTTMPDAYIAEATVKLPVGKDTFDIHLRFTVFGELLEYDCPEFELPEAALRLTYSPEAYTKIKAEFDYLPYRLLQMAFCRKQKYTDTNPWKPIADKLLTLQQGRSLLDLKLPATHELAQEICELRLPVSSRSDVFHFFSLIYTLSTTPDRNLRTDVIQHLGLMKNPYAIGPLIRALNNNDYEISLSAAYALGNIGDTRASKPLLDALQQNYGKQLSIIAAIGLGVLKDPDTLPQLEALLTHNEVHVCISAAIALANLQNSSGLQILLDALANQQSVSSHDVAYALGVLKDIRSVEPLIAVVNKGPSHISEAAIEALGNIGDTRAVEPLINALKKEPLQFAAIQALGKLNDHRAADPLAAILTTRKSSIRFEAALALAKMGDTRATKQLVAFLKTKHKNYSHRAAEALGKLNDISAVEPLIAAISYKKHSIVLSSISALSKLKDARAIKPFITILKSKKRYAYYHSVTVQAFYNLGKLAMNPLLEAMKNKNVEFRKHIANSISMSEVVYPIQPLLVFLNDSNEMVRFYISHALRKWEEAAVEPLIAILKNRKYKGRANAANVLGYFKDARALPPLLEALTDTIAGVRKSAAFSLGNLGDKGAVLPLIKALKDKAAEVRWNAVSSLGQLGDVCALMPIIGALKDKESQVRWKAATALKNLGDPRAIEPLVIALGDKHNWVRAYAAIALGSLGDARAIEPLIKMLKPHRSLLINNKDALVSIGEAAIAPLSIALNREDQWVRQNIVEILGKIGSKKAIAPLQQRLSIETNIACRSAIKETIEKLTQLHLP